MRRQRLRDALSGLLGRRLQGAAILVGLFVLIGDVARLVLS